MDQVLRGLEEAAKFLALFGAGSAIFYVCRNAARESKHGLSAMIGLAVIFSAVVACLIPSAADVDAVRALIRSALPITVIAVCAVVKGHGDR